jgi:hypothetical protein
MSLLKDGFKHEYHQERQDFQQQNTHPQPFGLSSYRHVGKEERSGSHPQRQNRRNEHDVGGKPPWWRRRSACDVEYMEAMRVQAKTDREKVAHYRRGEEGQAEPGVHHSPMVTGLLIVSDRQHRVLPSLYSHGPMLLRIEASGPAGARVVAGTL